MNEEPKSILPRVLAAILFIGLVALILLSITPKAHAADRATFTDADARRIREVVQALDAQRTMAPEPVFITRNAPGAALPPEVQRLLPPPGMAPKPDQNTSGIDPRSLQWALRTPPLPPGAAMRYTSRELEILLRTPPAVGGVRP